MRSILFAVLGIFLIIGAVEYGYRYTGGVPSITPGKTRLEFQWEIRQIHGDRIIYFFVGDSRIDWGFADRLFTKLFNKLQDVEIQAVNAGFAGGTVKSIIEYILDNSTNINPGVLVINFTPGSFCLFNNSPGPPISDLKLQDYLDHRIANYLKEVLYTYDTGLRFIFKHFQKYIRNGYIKKFAWFSRTLFCDGFVNAEAGYNDGSERVVDISPYQNMFKKLRKNSAYFMKRMDETCNVIRKAKRLGWTVILIRIPIGNRLMKLESELPEYFQPERVAFELSLPFIDYFSDPRTSYLPRGESHLLPYGTRKLSFMLASDISRLLMSIKVGGD